VAKKNLTIQHIQSTALMLIEQHGLEALSMRLLAKELNVDPMAMYHHIPNKTALLNKIYNSVVADLLEQIQPSKHWQENLKQIVRLFRGLARTHPRLTPSLIATSHEIENMTRLLEMIYTQFLEAGFDEITTLQASDTLFAFVTGFVLLESNPSEPPQVLGDLPSTSHILAVMQRHPIADSFEFGLSLLIVGFAGLLKL
jgi:TetR/AcrR family transcriptional regulator, tetracycline repressor protein